jgi:hypothetical protein
MRTPEVVCQTARPRRERRIRRVLRVLACTGCLACGGRSALDDYPRGSATTVPTAAAPPDESVPPPSPASGVDADAPSAVDASQADATADAPWTPADAGSVDADGGDGTSPSDPTLPSTAACLTGGNVLWVDGEPGSWWLGGTQTDSVGTQWSGGVGCCQSQIDDVTMWVDLPGGGSTSWSFGLQVQQPMMAGETYSNAPNPPAGAFPVPSYGLLISYPVVTHKCEAVGTFRIDAISADLTVGAGGGPLETLTAAFSVVCGSGVLRGCMHYDSQNP